MELIEPKVDIAFKKIFGVEYNALVKRFDEGKMEAQIEYARNMLIDNMRIDAVVKYTGLSV